MNEIPSNLFPKIKDRIVLDVKSFLNHIEELDGDMKFQLYHWGFSNISIEAYGVVENFSYLEDKDPEYLEFFLFECLRTDLKIDFEELLKLKQIPTKIVNKVISQLSDFYSYYDIRNQLPITEVITIFDERLDSDEKIELEVGSDGKDKALYIELRDSMDLRLLKNFSLDSGIYLSEVWNEVPQYDPLAISRGLVEKCTKGEIKYKKIYGDFNNIINSQGYKDIVEIIKICYRNGILMDTTFLIDDLGIKINKTIFNHMYNSASDKLTSDSFAKMIENFGPKFLLTKNFDNLFEGKLELLRDYDDGDYLKFTTSIDNYELISTFISDSVLIQLIVEGDLLEIYIKVYSFKGYPFVLAPKAYFYDEEYEKSGRPLPQIQFY